MIVRDSRSPRGRYEDSGPSSEYSRLQAIGHGFMAQEGANTDWHAQSDRSAEARKRTDPAFAASHPPRNLVQPTTANCQRPDCGAPFTTFRGNARFCSDRCRRREYKRRTRAA